jgi:hypothetical protein
MNAWKAATAKSKDFGESSEGAPLCRKFLGPKMYFKHVLRLKFAIFGREYTQGDESYELPMATYLTSGSFNLDAQRNFNAFGALRSILCLAAQFPNVLNGQAFRSRRFAGG